ncbi:methyl-accepting chemotaxis protein [Persicimonas caeni]|uniref:Methyl-accepting chemotaxis protein n=1 Tax=Persicimonas caeni TaxID=2292766 RepID=A0A4Y6PN08_PERCE|nr:methyl-accepting chemotaxis protein [Persicimonas caeni]QDG49609.1 methyl-accepting chemotaxis protein [Persicimonas caeni]QED30830.1 methyl-accepting chemotaxis protein [Persicimonas caeni]
MQTWKQLAMAIGALTVVAVGVAIWHEAYVAAAVLLVVGLAVVMYARQVLLPFDQVTEALGRLAAGDLAQPRLTVDKGGDVGRMATAINQLLTQLRLLSEEATELANGYIGVRGMQDRVLETGQLSAVDLPTSSSQGDLNRSFAELTNQLRRLTVKAHIIANDQLYNPALDEELPGELGDAFGLMVSNLRNLAGRAEEIAHGDLSSSVEGEGDLTSAFNEMVTGLRHLVEQITHSAIQVASSTEEMLQVLHAHESSALHQADRIREAQRTVEELLESADAIAERAHLVFEAAEDTRDQNRQIGMRIDELNQLSKRITEILKLIRSIADRSDLLALNASLEGARTGEAGKGFALVANEMRRLAENTKDSVGSIKSLVDDIHGSTRATASACQEGLVRSEDTTEAALDIKVVTTEQREHTGEVNRAMEDLATLVTHGVSGIRQVTTAASELAELSETLRELVDSFRLGEKADGPELESLPTASARAEAS